MWKDKQRFMAYQKVRREKIIDLLRALRKAGACKTCGWKEHPEILHFHHRDPETKSFKLSAGNIGSYAVKTVLKEVEKCDLLCPNCHVYLHFLETATRL